MLPVSRRGIAAAALVGLGRAMGETIAVVLLIGYDPQVARHLFWPGYSLAAAIVSELGAAAGPHRSALFAAGLILFVLTGLVSLSASALARERGALREGERGALREGERGALREGERGGLPA